MDNTSCKQNNFPKMGLQHSFPELYDVNLIRISSNGIIVTNMCTAIAVDSRSQPVSVDNVLITADAEIEENIH